jgi:EAL and modified HD-GYP domain-containing signal transduction protein
MSIDNIFLARQPIVDRQGELYGFELLFRHSDVNQSQIGDGMAATSTVIGHLLAEMGLAQVLGRMRGFLNVNAAFMASDLVELLSPDRIVLEVLEDTFFDAAFIERCRELRARGFDIALVDYCGDYAHIEALLPVLTIVKIDLAQVAVEWLPTVCAPLMKQGLKCVAEKVETAEQFRICLEAGFDLFQGYHFAHPEVLHARRSAQSRASMLRLLALIYGDAEIPDLEEEFKRNPQLGYNLLRLVNSASSGLRTKIASIKHALVLLGRRQLQVWLQLLLYTGDRADAQLRSPLLQAAAMRGCVMEALARHEDPQGEQYHDYAFMTGMLSLIDVLLGVPLAEMIDQLNVVDEVRDGLLTGEGRLGRLLAVVRLMETEQREGLDELLKAVRISPEEFLSLELGALRWSNNLFDAEP